MKVRIAIVGMAVALFCFTAATFAQESPYTPGTVWGLTSGKKYRMKLLKRD